MLLTFVLAVASSKAAATLASRLGKAVVGVSMRTLSVANPRAALSSVNRELTTHKCILVITCSATRSGKSLPGRL